MDMALVVKRRTINEGPWDVTVISWKEFWILSPGKVFAGPTLAATFSGILVHWAITLGTIRKEKSKV